MGGRKINLCIFALVILAKGRNADVELRFRLEPIHQFPYLLNHNLEVDLICEASYPVELISNVNIGGYGRDVTRNENEKQSMGAATVVEPSPTGGVYDYRAAAMYAIEWLANERSIVCRAVANHSDNIILTMKPETVGELDLVYTETTLNAPVEKVGFPEPEWPCKVKFRVTRAQDGYYWMCTTSQLEGHDENDADGAMYFVSCDGAEKCANVHRSDKASAACVEQVPEYMAEIQNGGWTPLRSNLDEGSGVAICVFIRGGRMLLLRVVEFFHEVTSLPGIDIQRTMRFSLPDTHMQNLIWMDPAPLNTPYYSREVLNTSCCIQRYGFAAYGQIIVTHDGNQIKDIGGYFDEDNLRKMQGSQVNFYWKKNVTIDFSTFGPGLYFIECLAPVWNTTEWANHNRTIEVRDQIPMQFTSGRLTRVAWMVGETNVTLNCDAIGDPVPKISWEPQPAGSYEIGHLLHIPLVTNSLPDLIMCTATNQFGETVTKKFQLDVTQPSLVIPIALSVASAAVVLLTLTVVSVKLWRRAKRAENLLTDEEVKEFLAGKPHSHPTYIELAVLDSDVSEQGHAASRASELQVANSENDDSDDEPLCAADIQLNSKFEVKKENFKIDTASKLGKGAYGVVCKGHIKLNRHDRNPTPVAVKQVPDNLSTRTRTFYLKALMSEILAYIGQHPNIAKLVGAYWENVQKGTLYVGIEFCKTSLLEFLRDDRKILTTSEQSISLTHSTGQLSSMITLPDMIRWASEISAGMEFLSRKRVVHSDLAARNVLLTFDLNAKVCDFGLARQLINTVYIKTSNSYLPWQWMAIESLRHREFSTRSDVWAFGVTLWEIFTLGDNPYPTAEWTDDGAFLYKLVDGMRLPKPEFATDEIYEVMRNCWQENPMARPKFGDLKLFFALQLPPEDVDAIVDVV